MGESEEAGEESRKLRIRADKLDPFIPELDHALDEIGTVRARPTSMAAVE
jgi:hypothetical protein